jgi:hypothetical protein
MMNIIQTFDINIVNIINNLKNNINIYIMSIKIDLIIIGNSATGKTSLI